MPLYVPETAVVNWYQYDVSFSFSLIKSFIEGIETQAMESIDRYEKEKETLIFTEKPEEGHILEVDVYQSLDDVVWELNDIFKEYFPSLQRRSAFLTLYGYFEHELDKLCLLYKSEKGFVLSLPDLSGRGIDRAINYLEKVAGIDVHRSSKEWSHIKNIQRIRNIAVHQNGKLKDYQGNLIKAAAEYVKQIDSLSGDTEIIIGPGFLTDVLNTYNAYFEMLNQSIAAKEKA